MASYGTLTITGPGGESHVMTLDRPEIIIGRDVGSDIMLDDPQASRFHARINCGPQGCAIADLVSSNGTLVNGHRISEPVDISGGAIIQIGGYTIAFQPGLAAGAPPTASLPYRSAPTMVAGGAYGPPAARRANPVVIIVGAAAAVVLLGILCCGASYLLGIDALMTPSLRAVSGIVPGIGEPLAVFYSDLHEDQEADALPEPTPTSTASAPEVEQPTPEEPSEAEATTPEPTEEAASNDSAPQPAGPTLAPSITVRNQSNLAFCGVFIRDSSESFWGDNRLTGASMPIGNHQLITIPGPGTYDIRVMDCSSPRITLENKLDVAVNAPYEWVVDGRYTLPPTATPTPTVTPTPEATPFVVFYADETEIDEGNCTDVHWNTENIKEVYYQNNAVTGNDERTVCPDETKTFTLKVIYPDNSEHTFKVTVKVVEP